MFNQFLRTEVVKHIVFLNVLIYIAMYVLGRPFIELFYNYGALHYVRDASFFPHQFITHMFMHSGPGLMHLFGNMFAVFMFGPALEAIWGPKRFLIFYMICGLGAAFCQSLSMVVSLYLQYGEILPAANMYPMLGASGAVMGVLFGFGAKFPNQQLMLLFPPIPIKAKYFVAIYAVMELGLVVANVPGDNIAHFAHLGGMLFAWILIKFRSY